jgi:tRNA-dihydrouridine synthase C
MDQWIRNGKAALVLAPMEGVTDAPMRALQTERPGFTHTVTEFLRVSQLALPVKTIRRQMTELGSGSRTASGIPVSLQLLGGDPELLAETARTAINAGAKGIDLNFGCPAPTVNRHDGGATLLKYPDRLENIIRAVRAVVPEEFPVSAKMRLGFDDPNAIYENAARAERAGASWITIHGRTKTQGYQPPAFWKPIGEVRRILKIPVIANGEIWSLGDFKRCQEETGCEHFMLGRGALANPWLVGQVAHSLGIIPSAPKHFPNQEEWRMLLQRLLEISSPLSDNPIYGLIRAKQWLRYVSMKREFPDFDRVKRVTDPELFQAALSTLNFPNP